MARRRRKVRKGGRPKASLANKKYPKVPTLAQAEKKYIDKVLKIYAQNRTKAANALAVARSTLIRKIHEYGL